MNSITMLKCPECDAVYILSGDFFENEGRILRASTTHANDCKRCAIIGAEIGLTENLTGSEANDVRRGD